MNFFFEKLKEIEFEIYMVVLCTFELLGDLLKWKTNDAKVVGNIKN